MKRLCREVLQNSSALYHPARKPSHICRISSVCATPYACRSASLSCSPLPAPPLHVYNTTNTDLGGSEEVLAEALVLFLDIFVRSRHQIIVLMFLNPLVQRHNPTPKSEATCGRVSPLAVAMRTASRRNSSVYLVAILCLLHSKHCSKETGTKP